MPTPADIIDYIFAYLQTDHTTLKLCSKAHPTLSEAAERHLFVHVAVCISADDNKIDIARQRYDLEHSFLVHDLSKRISEEPHLVNRIRCLYMYIDSMALSSHFDQMCSILSLIPRLEKIELGGLPPLSLEWLDLPGAFRTVLVNRLSSSSMKEVCLRACTDFPLTVLNGCETICDMTLNGSSCDYTESVTDSLFPQIKSLSLYDLVDPEFVTWAKEHIRNLTSLQIRKFKMTPMVPLLEDCSKSLTKLTIDIETQFRTTYRCTGTVYRTVSPPEAFPFSLSGLHNLKTLIFQALITARSSKIMKGTNISNQWMGASALPTITQLIKSAPSSLEHVILDLQCFIVGVDALRDGIEWTPLILLLDDSRPSMRINLRMHIHTDGYSKEDVVDALFDHKDLARLVNQNVLTIMPEIVS